MRSWIALAAILPSITAAAPAATRAATPDRARTQSAPAVPAAVRAQAMPAAHAEPFDLRAVSARVRPDRVRQGRAGAHRALLGLARGRTAGGRYVALGDSFTAGPLIPRQHGSPFACLRSDHNYPSLLARSLHAGVLADVSCSAATTAEMFRPQRVLFGSNPAQLDAVTPDTALVTVGIGGNDIGFSRTLYTCAGLSLTSPRGAPCAKHFGAALTGRVAATAPRIAAILQAVHQRAPYALVVVVGYLRVLPDDTGCWPSVPAAAGDVPYLDRVERSLNGMLADQARRGGALFVDDYRGGVRHDMCATHRWVEPILLTHAAMPVHPNAAGMRVVAARVLAALRSTVRSAATTG